MNPGRLRHDAQNWQPADRRRTDHAPDEQESPVPALTLLAFIGALIAVLVFIGAQALIGWLAGGVGP